MLIFARKSDVGRTSTIPSDDEATLLRMEERLPPVLSVMGTESTGEVVTSTKPPDPMGKLSAGTISLCAAGEDP